MTTSSPPFTRRLINTPMRDLIRGRITGRLDLDAQLAASALPPEAVHCIRTTVKRTRLWRLEKTDVAAELIAHFADGLAAGVAVDQLVKDFGDPRKAAKLIRRAKRRQRPLIWHVQRRCRQVLFILLGLYLVMLVWLMMGTPHPTVDYVAKMNEAALAVPKEDRAWSIYCDAFIKHNFVANRKTILDTLSDVEKGRQVRPNDPTWANVVALLDDHAHLLDAIRQGAQKPGLGLAVGFYDDFEGEDAIALFGSEWTPPQVRPPENTVEALARKSLLGVILPHLGPLQTMAALLRADLLRAAERGNHEQVVVNIRCMFGLARQARENQTLIADLAGRGILNRMCQILSDVLVVYPHLLRDDQLVDLTHQLSPLDDMSSANLDGDRHWFLDTTQRMYDERGRITDEGLRFFVQALSNPNHRYGWDVGGIGASVGLPVAYAMMASRHELEDHYTRLMDMAELHGKRPLWEQLHTSSGAGEQIKLWQDSPRDRIRYAPLMVLVPAVDTACRSAKVTMAMRDAVQVAIALELNRRHHGGYPDSLTMLVPRYLPQEPVDHSTGLPLLYKIVDGKPLLYGRGRDGDDDGGVMTEVGRRRWERVPEEGDWVVFPYQGE